MKNSKKIIWLMTVLFMSFMLHNCSDSQEQAEEEFLEQRNRSDSTIMAQRAFTCHSFTIGSSIIGISTEVYYCCAGETLCGGPALLGCVCGFVSESTYNEISEYNREYEPTNKISVKEFVKDLSQKTFNISYSSSIFVDGIEYSVKCKDYEIDKFGYITLELLKN